MDLQKSISRLGIGSWQLSGPTINNDGEPNGFPDYLGEEATIKLIKELKNRGINFIDTALNYVNGQGLKRIAKSCKSDRKTWIISSKFGERILNTGQVIIDLSASQANETLEITLEMLETSYLDMYLCHYAPETKEQCEDIAKFLTEAKEKSRIRAIGVSSNNLDKINMLHQTLQQTGASGLDIVQFDCNMLAPDTTLHQFLETHNILGIARGVLARGKLSGKYFNSPPSYSEEHIMAGKPSHQFFTEYSVFQKIMSLRGPVHTAYRYVFDFPTIASIIVGGKELMDYQIALEALQSSPLTQKEQEDICAIRDYLAQREIELTQQYQKPISLLTSW